MITVKELANEFLAAEWDDPILDVAYEIAFDYEPDGITILNPWYDPTGRFELSDAEAVATYGKENVDSFIARAEAYIKEKAYKSAD